jgi:pimeloyl-ACP methyl ester carboxylesterase
MHRFIETNNITMHITEAGKGPLVILCHGFPETWYSWRHQLPALGAAGYHVVAPDQRGYGETTRPDPIDAYTLIDMASDIVGLVYALGETQAVIVGHDFGAPVSWYCALLRPDVFRAVALLGTPYQQRPWNAPRPTEALKRMAGDKEFYQLYFQDPGKAEAELEADLRKTTLGLLYSLSGDAPPEKRWRYLFDKNERFIDTIYVPDSLPGWLSEDDIAMFMQTFQKTGYRGGLNWYRNIDRNWERTAFLAGAKINQPSLFIAGELDPVVSFRRSAFDALEQTMPNLRKKVLIPGAGHWIQQERPNEVNNLLQEFLGTL